MDIVFLDLDDALHIHANQIELYGGTLGVRDMGALMSALHVPRSGIDGHFFHGDLFAMAAAYLYHIVKNHPFIDGNKRAGFASALAFLDVNGWEVIAPDSLAGFVLDVISGKRDKADVAQFFRESSRAVTGD